MSNNRREKSKENRLKTRGQSHEVLGTFDTVNAPRFASVHSTVFVDSLILQTVQCLNIIVQMFIPFLYSQTLSTKRNNKKNEETKILQTATNTNAQWTKYTMRCHKDKITNRNIPPWRSRPGTVRSFIEGAHTVTQKVTQTVDAFPQTNPLPTRTVYNS